MHEKDIILLSSQHCAPDLFGALISAFFYTKVSKYKPNNKISFAKSKNCNAKKMWLTLAFQIHQGSMYFFFSLYMYV